MNKNISENLTNLRNSKNLELSDVAFLLKIEESALWDWEAGTSSPSLEEVKKIAEFYAVTPADLLSPPRTQAAAKSAAPAPVPAPAAKPAAQPAPAAPAAAAVPVVKSKFQIFYEKYRRWVISGAVVAFVLLLVVIYSVSAAVSSGSINKNLRGKYYLANVFEYNFDTEDLPAIPLMEMNATLTYLAGKFDYYGEEFTVSDKKELVFKDKTPIKFKLVSNDLWKVLGFNYFPDYFVDPLFFRFPNEEIENKNPYGVATATSVWYKETIYNKIIYINAIIKDGANIRIFQLQYSKYQSNSLLAYLAEYSNYTLSRILKDDAVLDVEDEEYIDRRFAHGEMLKLYNYKFELSGTQAGVINPHTAYTKNGVNLVFSDPLFTGMGYSAKIEGDKFSLIITNSTTQVITILEYIKQA